MSIKMKQLIIARKDLNMSVGKLAAQCCHASMAFLISPMRNMDTGMLDLGESDIQFSIDRDIYENWVCDIYTKVVCEAKNKTQLLKARKIATEIGLVEGKDFFLIKDHCLTELSPEETEEDGTGTVITCIGFRPLPEEIIDKISKKFRLYKRSPESERLISIAKSNLNSLKNELYNSDGTDDFYYAGVIDGDYSTWIKVLNELGVNHSYEIQI